MKLSNTIIYLIGIPAVGKYTVAKEIGRMTGAKIVDNQLINTPVFSVLGYDGTDAFPFPHGAWAQIGKIRRAVLAVIRYYCPPDASFVFTNTLDAREPLDKVWFSRIERLARQRGARFFPVWLTCEAAVIRGRKDTPDRRARLKDIDLTNIRRWSEEVEVLKVPHPNALTLDTSYCQPTQTAQRILEHVQRADQVGRTALVQTGTLSNKDMQRTAPRTADAGRSAAYQ